ncbi:hypothetical protein J41TS4_35560 [Paenibacillus apis]|uniref:Uncharacterized protein n=1 Tax=Paenibacillus apis TaxID=1792174 RepID=A0A920CNR5_9BACL|nr:hypothetical protein J41TS4_35560 [Paenibacillus apis]
MKGGGHRDSSILVEFAYFYSDPPYFVDIRTKKEYIIYEQVIIYNLLFEARDKHGTEYFKTEINPGRAGLCKLCPEN